MEFSIPNVSSIFLSTFNMNGKGLSDDDARRWLLGNSDYGDYITATPSPPSIHDANLIILSLQECPTYPDQAPPEDTNNLSRRKADSVRNMMPCVSVFGPPIIDDTKEHDRLPSTIQKLLSDDHSLIVDIAMGEPNMTLSLAEREDFSLLNCSSLESDDHTNSSEKIVERWYGFIRLMIYAKSDVADYISSSTLKHNGESLVPILSPAGRKNYSTYDNIALESCSGLWKKRYNLPNCSPDKGGVCIAIPSLNLLVCSLHLCGTNKYYAMESEFDKRRIQELIRIGQNCVDELHIPSSKIARDGDVTRFTDFREYKKIVLGDLNFRVEVCEKESEKGRGGPDFQLVFDIINNKSNSKENLNSLFWKYDRLVKLLHSIEEGQLLSPKEMKKAASVEPADDLNKVKEVRLLQNVKDLFMEYSSEISGRVEDHGGIVHIPPPTFSLCSKRERRCVRNGCDRCDDRSFNVALEDYANKRTPSWPDRILVDEQLLDNHSKGSYEISWMRTCHNILVSDHVPVNCFLQGVNRIPGNLDLDV